MGMNKIEFAGDWRRVFEQAGLVSVQDYFDYADGLLVNKNSRRDVTAFSLDTEAGSADFFMKRFFDPHYKDMLFAFVNHGSLCSQGQLEWVNVNVLLSNGIDTYRPVCYGVESRLGLEKRSFMVTEKIQGECLADYLSSNWSGLSQTDKENLVRSLGHLARKIHDARISFPDLYVWHVFVTGDQEFAGLAVIDLHRMCLRMKGLDYRARNLGAFDHSMREKYFDADMKDLFLKTYLGTESLADASGFLNRVQRRSQVLTARRDLPDY